LWVPILPFKDLISETATPLSHAADVISQCSPLTPTNQVLKSLCGLVKMLAQQTANVKLFLKMRGQVKAPLKKQVSVATQKRIILCLASAWV